MSPIHLLTGQGVLAQATVACGARDAALGTWNADNVTCAACQRGVCTCGPQVPLCPTCRAYHAAHRGRPTSSPPLKTEKQFQDAVRQLALANGFLFYHVYDSRRTQPGFPDILMVKGPMMILSELKMPGKHPTPAQQMWLDALAQVQTVSTHLWRPEDWDRIDEVVR